MANENKEFYSKETNGTSPMTGLFAAILFGICLFYPVNCAIYNIKADDVRKEMRARTSELTDVEYNRLNEEYFHYKKKARDFWYDSR